MRIAALICLCLLSAGCARASEAGYEAALERAGRLMVYSHEREATAQHFIEKADPSAACPNFRAAAARADAAAGGMRQAGHPDDAWADAHGWGKALASAAAQREAMELRARQVCQ